MPISAPDTTLPATLKRLSVRMIDQTGDVRTDSYDFDVSVTALQITAFVLALAVLTQADIYEVSVSEVWASVADAGNALTGSRDSVFDNMVFLAKNAIKDSVNFYVPAPLDSLFLPETDEIAVDTDLSNLFTAFLALQNAGTLRPDMTLVSGRYTERKEINKKIKI